MSKSCRSRKLDRLRRKSDEILAAWQAPSAISEEVRSYAEARERALADRLRALFTPEYVEEIKKQDERLAEMQRWLLGFNRQIDDWLRRLRKQAGAGGMGRTKRLKKKRAKAFRLERL